MLKPNKYIYYAAFLAITILAFWQIAFFIHPVKYDMVDCFYPWRYFIGECLQNGELPLWNPYQLLGSPIHADPSSGAWYPFVWFIGYFIGYNVYTIGLEFLFHIFIAGIGFYKLAKTLKLNDNTAFIAGVCYMLCGLFVGNAQHLTYVISACWLPFVLHYYFKLAEEKTFMNSIKAALCLFLMITGGYPAFTIILFYLLLIFFIYHTVGHIKEKNKKGALLFVFRNGLFVIVTFLLSCGMLLAIYQVAPYITRIDQFPLQKALFSPFSPQSIISFLLPFATLKETEFFATDISMSNAYFGLPMFVFFLMSLFVKKKGPYKILFWFALFCLTAAVGSYLPVREFLFDYIPMMNIFRFPSVFRLFVVIGFILCGALWLNDLLNNEAEEKKITLKNMIIVLLALFGGTIITMYSIDYVDIVDFIKKHLFVVSQTSTIFQHIAFQSFVQVGVLAILLLILLKEKDKTKRIQYITVLIIVDLIIATQIHAPYTVHYDMFKSKEASTHSHKFPKNYPLLKDVNIADVKQDDISFGPFWKNLNIFQRQVSADGFNSFAFTKYDQLRDETPHLFAATIKNRIVFLSDQVLDESTIKNLEKDSAFNNKMVFFKSGDLLEIDSSSLKHTKGDTAQLVSFSPDRIVVLTRTKQKQLITLLQNNYIGWEVFINNERVKHYTANVSLISVVLPAGNNTVNFIYDNKCIRKAVWVSMASLLICLLLVVGEWVVKGKRQKSSNA